MPANNQSGANGTSMFEGFNDETAYGAIKRLKQTTQAAPMARNPALGAPDRARKRKGQPQQPAGPPVEQQLGQAPPASANIWAEVAAIPGAPDSVQQWAQDA